MAELRYLLDEHLRGPLWKGIQWHNRQGAYPVDVLRVGDPTDLPLGTKDPAILLWAEAQDRILVSHDRGTLSTHLADHLSAGHGSPGIFLLRSPWTIPEIVEFLVDAAYASKRDEWRNQVTYIP